MADDPMGYAFGAGAVIPIGGDITGNGANPPWAGPGLHLDGGGYFKIHRLFAAGLHVTYDLPMSGGQLKSGNEPDFQFVGILARAMYTGGDKFKYWAAIGFGMFIDTFTSCSDVHCSTMVVEKLVKAGMDISIGAGYAVWGPLSLGPAITATFPSIGNFADQMVLSISVRGHWNL